MIRNIFYIRNIFVHNYAWTLVALLVFLLSLSYHNVSALEILEVKDPALEKWTYSPLF